MLVKPHAFFAAALEQGFAIGAFNSSNLEFTQAIVAAAETKQAPVIVQTSETAIDYAGLKVITNLVRTIADTATVPVILHLDHGKSIDRAKACIDAGYTSVMIDASTKSFADNIKMTTEVVKYAHDRGVWVEAELGAILGKEGAVELGGKQTPLAMLTDPRQAKEFIQTTGVDALAVSVGTIHGAFTGQEYIRFELLEEIQTAVPLTPLALHGASGIADAHLKRVVDMQVCKINIDTELRLAWLQATSAALSEVGTMVDPRTVLGAGREAVQTVVEKKIELFGSGGKATVH
jgi:fructose-bisphosphate aldolase class II